MLQVAGRSDEFATGTRVLSVLPVAEGPVFHHPNCEPGCREPSFDWVTERGATVAETIRHWLDEGVIEGWRSEAFQDAVERAEGLRQGDRTTRNYEIAWDESRPLRSADSEAYDLDHLWRSYIIVSEVEVLPASAKHTKWFLRRLDEGEWRFLAALARRTQA